MVAREQQIQPRRDGHAPDRCQRGHHRATHAAQLTNDDLAFDLGADDEKEDRHQAVVDPQQQWQLKLPATDLDAERCFPQGVVAGTGAAVAPDERRDQRADQEQTALGAQSSLPVQRRDGQSDADRDRSAAEQTRSWTWAAPYVLTGVMSSRTARHLVDNQRFSEPHLCSTTADTKARAQRKVAIRSSSLALLTAAL